MAFISDSTSAARRAGSPCEALSSQPISGEARSSSALGRLIRVRASMLSCWSMLGWNASPAISGLSTLWVSM